MNLLIPAKICQSEWSNFKIRHHLHSIHAHNLFSGFLGLDLGTVIFRQGLFYLRLESICKDLGVADWRFSDERRHGDD